MKLTEERLVKMILEELNEINRDPKTGEPLSVGQKRTRSMQRRTGGPGTVSPSDIPSETQSLVNKLTAIVRASKRMNFPVGPFEIPDNIDREEVLKLAPQLKDYLQPEKED